MESFMASYVAALNSARQKTCCSPEGFGAPCQTASSAVLLVKSSWKGEPLLGWVIYQVIYEVWERTGISEALLGFHMPSTFKVIRSVKRQKPLFVSEVKFLSLMMLEHKQTVFLLSSSQGNWLFPCHYLDRKSSPPVTLYFVCRFVWGLWQSPEFQPVP